MDVIGTATEQLNNDIGDGKDGGAIREDSAALVEIGRVEIAGGGSGVGLDDHLVACFGQLWYHHRDQRDTPFSGETLFGDSDDHEATILA